MKIKADDPITMLGVGTGGQQVCIRVTAKWARLYPGDPWRQNGYWTAADVGVRLWPEDEGTTWVRGHDDAAMAQMLLVRSARE